MNGRQVQIRFLDAQQDIVVCLFKKQNTVSVSTTCLQHLKKKRILPLFVMFSRTQVLKGHSWPYSTCFDLLLCATLTHYFQVVCATRVS